MGRIIGEKKIVEKTFTKEEIEVITNDLNSKIVELSEKVDNLTIENKKSDKSKNTEESVK